MCATALAALTACGSSNDAAPPPATPRPSDFGASEKHFVGSGPKVAILGDSLTVLGWNGLYRSLDRDHRVAITAWKGEGYGAGSLAAALKRPALVPLAARTVYAPQHPDVVVLAIGTNDAWSKTRRSNPRAVMRSMLDRFPSSCVVGVLLPEDLSIPDWSNTEARSLNAATRKWADEIVDWPSIARRPGMLKPDQVHTTGPGTRARDRAIAGAVRRCTR